MDKELDKSEELLVLNELLDLKTEEEDQKEVEKVDLINTFMKFYKRHYGHPYNTNMFENIDYQDHTSTNHCMEMMQKYIDEYYKNCKNEDLITIFAPELMPKYNNTIYVLTKKNNEKLLCMSLLPLLEYARSLQEEWRVDIIKN